MAKMHGSTPFFSFVGNPSAGGLLLLACVILSLLIANSPLAGTMDYVLIQKVGFTWSAVHLDYTLASWINDGLMAVFFLMAGLEIKKELVEGQLSGIKQAALPALCAIGGMVVPAGIYLLFNHGKPTAAGWGIPMATDIAFAVAILTALKKVIPASVKVFLTALAIVDDLGAIIVVAIFYTDAINATYLLYAAGVYLLMLLFNRLNFGSLWWYLVPGMVLWYFVHHSGIHATIAGVLTALAVPVKTRAAARPADHLEHLLQAPVNFIILPLFALANTNIRIEAAVLGNLFSPLGLGILCGLFLGKPIGIVIMAWTAIKTRVGKMPDGTNWRHITGLGILAGIGFTMSIFISLLSFKDPGMQSTAKLMVLLTSLLSAVTGYICLSVKKRPQKPR